MRVQYTVILGFVVLALALPATVAAHSELEKAAPADGAVVAGTPAEIVLTFSETLDPAKSSVTLHDPAGAEIAKTSVDAADDTVMRIVPPSLAAGKYEVRWTSAALDGDILRGTVHFTVTAPTPSATPNPTENDAFPTSPPPSPSASPSATPGGRPSTSPSPSSAPGRASASGGDVLLPIIVAVVVVGILGAMLLRGRSRGGGAA